MSQEERRIKQVIVVRKDLNMRKGKIAAQAAHASMKVFLDVASIEHDQWEGWKLTSWLTTPMADWLNSSFAKVCLYVESEEHLLELLQQAKDADISAALITDSGRTEFHGVPTNTCIAIGPHYADEIDKITGELKLL